MRSTEIADFALAGGIADQNKVRMAVAIHVLHSGGSPACEPSSGQLLSRGDGCAFRTSQIVDDDLLSRIVLENEIGMPIRVEITGSDKIPSGCGKLADGLGAKESGAIASAEK
jgi:hypothetical protein